MYATTIDATALDTGSLRRPDAPAKGRFLRIRFRRRPSRRDATWPADRPLLPSESLDRVYATFMAGTRGY